MLNITESKLSPFYITEFRQALRTDAKTKGKKPQCQKPTSYNCGKSCINISKNCKNTPDDAIAKGRLNKLRDMALRHIEIKNVDKATGIDKQVAEIEKLRGEKAKRLLEERAAGRSQVPVKVTVEDVTPVSSLSEKPPSHSDYIKISNEEEELLKNSPLQGTEKQVAWAEKLRKNSIIQAKLEASLYAQLLTKDNPSGEDLSVDDFKEVSDLIVKIGASKKDAKFWIDRQYSDMNKDLVEPAMARYIERLSENDDPRLTKELKETALRKKKERLDKINKTKVLAEKYKNIQKPELEGTERQVSWAVKIRDGFLSDSQREGIEAESVQTALENEVLKNSKFWIENRGNTIDGNRLSKEGMERIKKIISKSSQSQQQTPVKLAPEDLPTPAGQTPVSEAIETKQGVTTQKVGKQTKVNVPVEMSGAVTVQKAIEVPKQKVGAKYLEDPSTNQWMKNHEGLKAIAKAIDENNGVIDTGTRPGFNDEFGSAKAPQDASKLGVVKVHKLNKPSKAHPYGSATVTIKMYEEDGKQNIDLPSLADGVKHELSKKQTTQTPVKLPDDFPPALSSGTTQKKTTNLIGDGTHEGVPRNAKAYYDAMAEKGTPITEQEAEYTITAIKDWSGSAYRYIRELQKQGQESAEANRIDKFIKNSTPYNGEIYRGISFRSEEEVRKWAKEGEILGNQSAHASWTSDLKEAEHFGKFGTQPVVIKAVNKTGASIKFLSLNSNESEVIVSKGAQHRVKKITKKEKYILVEVEEV